VLQHTATPLLCVATDCNTIAVVATHCNTIKACIPFISRRDATHCNTLQLSNHVYHTPQAMPMALKCVAVCRCVLVLDGGYAAGWGMQNASRKSHMISSSFAKRDLQSFPGWGIQVDESAVSEASDAKAPYYLNGAFCFRKSLMLPRHDSIYTYIFMCVYAYFRGIHQSGD